MLVDEENRRDLLITKYYIKSLLAYDEYQLGVEARQGFEQLLDAEKLNRSILVEIHGHTKETVKIKLSKV